MSMTSITCIVFFNWQKAEEAYVITAGSCSLRLSRPPSTSRSTITAPEPFSTWTFTKSQRAAFQVIQFKILKVLHLFLGWRVILHSIFINQCWPGTWVNEWYQSPTSTLVSKNRPVGITNCNICQILISRGYLKMRESLLLSDYLNYYHSKPYWH